MWSEKIYTWKVGNGTQSFNIENIFVIDFTISLNHSSSQQISEEILHVLTTVRLSNILITKCFMNKLILLSFCFKRKVYIYNLTKSATNKEIFKICLGSGVKK